MARRRGHTAARRLALLAVLLAGAPALAVDLKLWPLFDYRSHAATAERQLNLLGPLVHYESGPAGWSLAIRPLLHLKRPADGRDNQVAVLYPLSFARWNEESSATRIFGLFTIDTRGASERKPEQWERRVNVYPFLFYRYSAAEGRRLSVVPFYADLREFFGYERIRMVLFPAFLKLEEPLSERTWLMFPFVSWAGGAQGRGWRVWPIFGWSEDGERARFHYVLWPFYINQELHWTRPERERRLVVLPFYAALDAPEQRTRAFLGPLFTHSINDREHTETWGFPWPLWLYQRDTKADRALTLRLAPFYQDRRQGNLRAKFVLWPLFRERVTETDDHFFLRRDFLFVAGRSITERQFAHRHQRTLSTLFPLWRGSSDDGDRRFGAPALLDALVPRNEIIDAAWAPLWRLYRSEIRQDTPRRWGVAWDLVSSDGSGIRYPLSFDLSE